MSKPQILLLLTIILKSSEWESTCDKTGNCKIIVDNEEIYLRPGYLPFYPVEEVNPINSDGTENINQQNFTLNILTGYPKKGILKGSKKQFECAGGMNECANSCCKEGYCKGTRHDCNNKYEKIEIIFIIVGSVFGIFLILFWIYFFIIGCNYNKIVERDLNDEKKELKENQNYGNFIQKKNSNNQSDSQIDEQISNLSHGTIQEENYNQFNNEKEENKFETIRKRLDNAPKRQINLNEE
jgi:hypothetical protein